MQDRDSKQKIHTIKIKFGILGAILLIGIFAVIFYGCLDVVEGWSSNGQYRGYLVHHEQVDYNNDGISDIILKSSREVETEEHIGDIGFIDSNEVAVWDPEDKEELWSYVFERESMVLGYLDLLNPYGSTGDTVSSLLVQYAQVESATSSECWESHCRYYKNETGNYETFLLNITEGANPLNLSDYIFNRISQVHNLFYNPDDGLPDFIVETRNDTWRQRDSGEIGCELSAFHANGTLEWQLNNTDPASPIYADQKFFDSDWNHRVYQKNKTHVVLVSGTGDATVLNLKDGSNNFNLTSSDTLVFEYAYPTYHDYDEDMIKDFFAMYYNESGESFAYGIFSGANGLYLDEGAFIDSIAYSAPFISYQDESFDSNLKFVNANDHEDALRFYELDDEGLQLKRTFSMDGARFMYNPIESGSYYLIADGAEYFYFGYFDSDHDREQSALLSLQDYEFAGETQSFGVHHVAINEYAGSSDYLELVITSIYESGLQILSLSPEQPLFRTSVKNLIFLIGGALMILTSTILLLLNRRQFMKLIPQNEGGKQENSAISKEDPETNKDKSSILYQSTAKIRKSAGIMLIIFLMGMISFIFFMFIQGGGDFMILGSSNFAANSAAYRTLALMCASLTLISTLYNHFSPKSAMLFIRIQSWFYNKLFKGRKHHEILVLDMSHSKKHSTFTIIQRSLFPLFISLTIGLSVFQAFGTESLTMIDGSTNIAWLAEFELYAGTTFVVSYLLLMFIIPGGWLLDDCGVVYFEEASDFNLPGDISRISDWLLNWLKGLFGFTALLKYYQLFRGLNFSTFMQNDDVLMGLFIIVFIIGLMLIGSPILYGLIVMFYGNTSMIGDLDYNRDKLFTEMEKEGLNTTPIKLKDFVDQRNKV